MAAGLGLLAVDGDLVNIGGDALWDLLLNGPRVEVLRCYSGARVQEVVVNGEFGCERGEDEELSR